MRSSLITGLALIGVTGTLAVPAPVPVSTRRDVVYPDKAACTYNLMTSADSIALSYYDIRIGRPFNHAVGCNLIKDSIIPIANISQYVCEADDDGNTHLCFMTEYGGSLSKNSAVIEALQKIYPMVPFEKDGTCLIPGAPKPDYWPSAKVKARGEAVDPDEAICTYISTNSPVVARSTYGVHIGLPFDNGAGCDNIKAAISDVANVGDWICAADDGDQTKTHLFFSTENAIDLQTNYNVIGALQNMYPMIPFKHDGICLEAGAPIPDGWRSTTEIPDPQNHAAGADCSSGYEAGSHQVFYGILLYKIFKEGDCKPLWNHLSSKIGKDNIYTFDCGGDGNGSAAITFWAGQVNKTTLISDIDHYVNVAFGASYPGVGFEKDTICSTHTWPASQLVVRDDSNDYLGTSCDSKYAWDLKANEYSLFIDKPFNNGGGCEPINVTLASKITVDYFACVENPKLGTTYISLIAHVDDISKMAEVDEGVNEGFGIAYPDIPFEDQKICNTPAPESKLMARDEAIDAVTATCTSNYAKYIQAITYDLHIDKPWNNGAGCNYISDALASTVDNMDRDNFECAVYGNGWTVISIIVYRVPDASAIPSVDDGVNAGFHIVWPDVAFEEQRICRTDPPASQLETRNPEALKRAADPGTATCSSESVSDDKLNNRFTIQVGRPWIDGDGCGPILVTIKAMIPASITDWQCKDDDGQTKIAFTVNNNYDPSSYVNKAMGVAYYDIDFDNVCGAPSKLKPRSSASVHGNNTCLGMSEDGNVRYNVTVSKPSSDASCNAVFTNLRMIVDSSIKEDEFVCLDHEGDTTVISCMLYNVSEADTPVNYALSQVYPDIPFQTSHICYTPLPLSTRQLSARSSTLDPGTVICSVEAQDETLNYTFAIGRPYVDGGGCDPIFDTLVDVIPWTIKKEEYVCEADESDQTKLSFIVHDSTDADFFVNLAMGIAYRDIPISTLQLCKVDLDPIDPTTASCSQDKPSRKGSYVYNIHVGKSFIEVGCVPTETAIFDVFGFNLGVITCEDDGDGQTKVQVHLVPGDDDGSKLNKALNIAYPDIPFESDNICQAPQKLKRRDDPIEAGTASCSSSLEVPIDEPEEIEVYVYNVQVGKPWANGDGCDSISDAFSDMFEDQFNAFGCEDDGHDQTHLTFYLDTSWSAYTDVNKVLGSVYPDIAFETDDICKSSSKLMARDDAPDPNVPMAPGDAYCGRTNIYNGGDEVNVAPYGVRIGRPFVGGGGCPPILATINSVLGQDVDPGYTCNDDGHEGTLIHFVVSGTTNADSKVDEALGIAYYDIPFDGVCHDADPPKLKTRQGNDPDGPMAPGQVFCGRSFSHGQNVAKYGVHIGRPWMDGGGCAPILVALQEYLGDGVKNGYNCFNDKKGGTRLHFVVSGTTNADANVEEALGVAYYDIDFHGVCRSYGPPPKKLKARDDIATESKLTMPDPIDPGTATCINRLELNWQGEYIYDWGLQIGKPFADGKGCNDIQALIESKVSPHPLGGFRCFSDGYDGTMIGFGVDYTNDVVGVYAGVVEALGAAYPDISFHDICQTLSTLHRLDRRDDPFIAEGQANCTWVSAYGSIQYHIYVGAPWVNGSGCGGIQDTIELWTQTKLDYFECRDDGYGQTELSFRFYGIPDPDQRVNEALAVAFANIAFEHACYVPSKLRARVDDPFIAPGAGICTSQKIEYYDGTHNVSYGAFIGRPFVGGAGCDPIKSTLEDKIGISLDAWVCKDDDYGQTEIAFIVPGAVDDLAKVNEGFDIAYPDVPFDCQAPSKMKVRDESSFAAGFATCRSNCGLSQEPPYEPDRTIYDIYVAKPFADGVGCADIQKVLNDTIPHENTNYRCQAALDGNTGLDFGIQGVCENLDEVNKALGLIWDDIPFVQDKICHGGWYT